MKHEVAKGIFIVGVGGEQTEVEKLELRLLLGGRSHCCVCWKQSYGCLLTKPCAIDVYGRVDAMF